MNDENRKADPSGAPLSAAGARPVGDDHPTDSGTDTGAESGTGVIVAGAAARARGDSDQAHSSEDAGHAGPADPEGPEGHGADLPRHTIAGRPATANGAAEVDPAREHAYWRESFRCRDYVEPDASFDDYGPAYDLGVRSRAQHPQQSFDEVASAMEDDWAASRGGSRLKWERAQAAARDAWNRLSPTGQRRA